MKPARFRYERPGTVAEALALLAGAGDGEGDDGEVRPLAGGQSLVAMLNLRLSAPAVVVDLNHVPGLDTIALQDGRLRVGAMTRQRTLERSPTAAAVGALADGLPLVGHVATRNRGTVGGSVAHADPAAEVPLALVALGGSVTVESGAGGRRQIPAGDFFTGFLATALRPGELVVEVCFPVPGPGEGSALVEVANRHGDFALAAAACRLRVDGDGRVAPGARVAVGAVADRPVLVPEAAGALAGADSADPAAWRAAGEAAAAAVEAGDSLHAPAAYRRHVTAVLVARAAARAAARARSGG